VDGLSGLMDSRADEFAGKPDPRVFSGALPQKEKDLSVHEHADRRILVVDDEAIVAEPTAEILRRRLGCQVMTADCGESALDQLSQYPFDVVITDMMMPGLHGLPLVRRLSSLHPLVRIIVMTAYARDFPYVDVVNAGAAEFMIKPYAPDELVAKTLSQLRIVAMREESAMLLERPDGAHAAVTEARSLQRASEERYRRLFEGSMNGMMLMEAGSFRVVEANPAFCDLAGIAHDDLLRRPALELLDENARTRIQTVYENFRRRRQGSLSDIHFEDAGNPVVLDINLSFIDAGGEELVLVMAKDVTEQREMHRQLAAIATTDALTGLANRRAFDARLQALVRQCGQSGESSALLFIDIDNFKQCNDTHGHQTGDDLLRRIGRIIGEQVRLEKDSGFRYGGDEFAVLLGQASPEVAARVADRIRSQYAAGECHGTSMSIGIAPFAHPMTPEAFVEAADAALYQAKTAGKNRVAIA